MDSVRLDSVVIRIWLIRIRFRWDSIRIWSGRSRYDSIRIRFGFVLELVRSGFGLGFGLGFNSLGILFGIQFGWDLVWTEFQLSGIRFGIRIRFGVQDSIRLGFDSVGIRFRLGVQDPIRIRFGFS